MQLLNNKIILPLILATVGLGSLPSAAGAFGISFIDNDNDFNDLNPNLAFVAEGRIGNNANNGTHELNIHGVNESNPTATSTQSNFVWTNGLATAFSLIYDATTRNITYQVGGILLQAIANENAVSDIFIRTRATMADTSIAIANLVFNGTALSQSFTTSGGGDWASGMEYLRISSITDSFTLTGTSLMSWGATRPSNSNLAYQIKVGNAEAVPEPISLLGLGLGASGLALMKKRVRQQAQ